MKINEIIRERRRSLGLTQEQAANRLGVTASAFNKWERAASMPDITLLPALARLLGVDLNTLLDFSDELSDSEIGEFVNSLDDTVQSEGYAAAFSRTEAKIREYPSCEKLLLSAAYYLDGALYMYDVEDAAQYRAKIDKWYDRLSESTDADVRASALVMVINRCRNCGELERAELLVNSLPHNTVDRQEQLALLYTAQGRADEARKLWQGRALEGISEAVTAMTQLMDEAVKAKRFEDAARIAGTIEAVNSAAGLPDWMGLSARIDLAEKLGDKAAYDELFERLKRSLETPWDASSNPIYSELRSDGVNTLMRRLRVLADREEFGGQAE